VHEAILEKTDVVEFLCDKNMAKLRRTEKVLLRGMFDATEVHVPTCFIIVNQKLEPEPSAFVAEEAPSIVEAATAAVDNAQAKVDSFNLWFGKLNAVGSSVAGAISKGVSMGIEGVSSVADSAANIGQALADLTAGLCEGERCTSTS
jgi:hypothetical protein